MAVLNGAGELTSSLQVREWGVIETPVWLTATHGRRPRLRRRRVARWSRPTPPWASTTVVIPVVGECDDSWLSEARVVQVEAADAGRAFAAAERGLRAGRGRRGHGDDVLRLEGRHRQLQPRGRRRDRRRARAGQLRRAGRAARRRRAVHRSSRRPRPGRDPAGSCIAVVATDAPLDAATLERVARRAGLGLARTGSVAHHGSGEIFLAFSTAPAAPRPTSTRCSPPPSTPPRRRSSTRSGRRRRSRGATAAWPPRSRTTSCWRPSADRLRRRARASARWRPARRPGRPRARRDARARAAPPPSSRPAR